jgi:hypothetical protein
MIGQHTLFRAFAGLALVAGLWLAGRSVTADENKADEKKSEKVKSGTVVGVVTAKEEKWIEVKADGEEKGRRYVPHWVGGGTKGTGGLDKEMLKEIARTPVGARIKLDWEFDERARVVKIEILKLPAKDKDKDK